MYTLYWHPSHSQKMFYPRAKKNTEIERINIHLGSKIADLLLN